MKAICQILWSGAKAMTCGFGVSLSGPGGRSREPECGKQHSRDDQASEHSDHPPYVEAG